MEADELLSDDDGTVTVNVVCRRCLNANRAARRACDACDHSGFERRFKVAKRSDGSIRLGGPMFDIPAPGSAHA